MGFWKQMGAIGGLATILVIVGAINWGLIGVSRMLGSDFNLVRTILASIPYAENIVYAIVGLSGLYSAYALSTRA